MLFFCIFGNYQFMKKFFIFCLFAILVLFVIGVNVTSENNGGFSNSDYLRIHIRANSNSAIDQNIKYKIKDYIVEILTPKLANCNTKQQVVSMISNERLTIENAVNLILKNNNFDYKSHIKINQEAFPTRTYEGYTLESGVYDAIIVELGEATGDNWWCVIYPPLCFVNGSSTTSNNIVYKSKIWEIINQFFNC